MRRIVVVVLACLLAGCGGGSSGDDSGDAAGLPKVTGSYGDKPKITTKKGETPGKTLQSTVLTKGDGPKVAKGDLLVADYLGEIYRSGKVFDNSYDRKTPASFTIGVGKVVKGWDKTLVGVPTGSRVLMVLPPKEGYGPSGNPQAGIKGTDSLVFVVDVIASYGATPDAPAPMPVTGLSTDLPKVTGNWGEAPTVTVPKGTKPPTQPKATVIATGAGEKVAKGRLIVVQYVASSWANKPLSRTWGADGPQGVPVGAPGAQAGANPFDLLLGTPVGSRVLLTLPAQADAEPSTDSVAVVIDVLGQNGTAKQETQS